MPISIGLNIWSRLVEKTFPYLDQIIEPFDSILMPDHVQYENHPVAEGWSLLAYALARYPDKHVGHAVLCNSFRNPAHLAKMASTLQSISGGRVFLGIGAGWNKEEYLAYNWPFPSARVRIAQLAESIEVIRALWNDSPANYAGEHYQLRDAHCEPRPDPAPPIMVGGAGEKYLLRVVAQHADWWNYIYVDRATYAHKQTVLQQHCRQIDREYEEIGQMTNHGILIAPNESDLQRLRSDPTVRPAGEGTLVGTAEQICEQLLSVIDQGASMLSVHFCDVPNLEGTQLFVEEVMPHLRAAG